RDDPSQEGDARQPQQNRRRRRCRERDPAAARRGQGTPNEILPRTRRAHLLLMAALSFGGVWSSLWRRSTRPTQVNHGEPVGTRSKVTVTPETAMRVTAVLCAARVIAEGVAQVPLKLFLETDDAAGRSVRKTARDHELYRLLAY